MTAPSPSDKIRVRRLPDRGRYDRDSVYAIIDAAMLCHVGFIQDGEPFVIPALHARRGDQLLLHGASSSRLLRHMEQGHSLSVSISLLDGVVLAKTAFNHSVNYRSVVLFGHGRLVDDPAEKLDALHALTERLVPGRWDHIRLPNAQEMKATSIVEVAIEEASAKVRNGPPKDDGEDKEWPVWAGVVPIRELTDAPVAAPYSADPEHVPPHVLQYVANRQRR